MAYGLKVWDASGNVIIDTSTRMTRVLGRTAIGTATSGGSVSHSDFAQGDPFWYCTCTDFDGGAAGFNMGPVFSFSGTTLSWTWSSATRRDCWLIYGVY